MRRVASVAAAVLLVGAACSSDRMAAMEKRSESGCANNSSTRRLQVAPELLARNDPVVLTITWALAQQVGSGAVATLVLEGRQLIEVEVDLKPASDDTDFVYVGSQLNPFGPTASTGSVAVVAAAPPMSGCDATPTAATSFHLE